MATYALVNGGIVTDVIVADAAFIATAPLLWKAKFGVILLVDPPVPVGPGWTWLGGLLFAPPLTTEEAPRVNPWSDYYYAKFSGAFSGYMSPGGVDTQPFRFPAGTLKDISSIFVYVVANTLDAETKITLYRNAVPLAVEIQIAAGATGLFAVPAGFSFDGDDTFDLGIVSAATLGSISLSANVEFVR